MSEGKTRHTVSAARGWQADVDDTRRRRIKAMLERGKTAEEVMRELRIGTDTLRRLAPAHYKATPAQPQTRPNATVDEQPTQADGKDPKTAPKDAKKPLDTPHDR